MEVKANTNIDAAQRVIVSQTRQRPAPEGSDTMSFRHVDELNEALKTTPEVRPDAVAHATELIANVKYPAADTIRSISTLLALKLDISEVSSE